MAYKEIYFNHKDYGVPSKNKNIGYHGYYSVDTKTIEYKEWTVDVKQFLNDIIIGNPVYIKYKSDNSAGRGDSIARVIGFCDSETLEYVKLNITDYLEHYHRLSYLSLMVKFDDRKNKLKPKIDDITWLKGYSGPTHWIHNPPLIIKPELKPILDRLGREVKLGDFVSYAITRYNTSRIDVYFGSVTKISNRNVVYCTNIKLNDNDSIFEEKIKDNSSMVLITKDLIDQLMIKRLSAN
jgi:hypothetical protein